MCRLGWIDVFIEKVVHLKNIFFSVFKIHAKFSVLKISWEILDTKICLVSLIVV